MKYKYRIPKYALKIIKMSETNEIVSVLMNHEEVSSSEDKVFISNYQILYGDEL